MSRDKHQSISTDDFVHRLRQIVGEFGSRYALAKASGIPASTLQSYETGSKPGIDALTRLAQIGNIDLNWLLTGKGEMRPVGLPSGALLGDILMIDQYRMHTARSAQVIIGQLPFSRRWLETHLRLENPTPDSLLLVEAEWNLHEVMRGDLVLADCQQSSLSRDGLYLLDLPGLALRGIARGLGDKISVIGPGNQGSPALAENRPAPWTGVAVCELMLRSDLLGDGRFVTSKVVGRAIWTSRQI